MISMAVERRRGFAPAGVWGRVALCWLIVATIFVLSDFQNIAAMHYSDPDDSLRMLEVIDWLGGQSWSDIHQYRIDPAGGGVLMHWSRLVDLPIAGLILAIRPFAGGIAAERWASALAPLLPLLPTLGALALVARRLVGPMAGLLTLVALLFAGSTLGMFQPLRIDHHGWQLALLAVALAGLADPRRARGGATVGIASALSLAIGLEMIIYLALLGVAQVLFWVTDRNECGRTDRPVASFDKKIRESFAYLVAVQRSPLACRRLGEWV